MPQHRALLPGLVAALAPDGWLAMQVPGNFTAPSHALLTELAAQEPFAAYTAEVARPSAGEPADYVADLAGLGCRVDAWETTYIHLLTGPDPVFGWIAGTGARPVLQALPDGLREEFVRVYRQRLRAAYPKRAWGTPLAFRRVFVVAQTPGGAA